MATRASWFAEIVDSGDTTQSIPMGEIPQFSFSKSITKKLGYGTFKVVNANGRWADSFIEGKDFKFFYGHDTIPYQYGGFIFDVDKRGEEITFKVAHYMHLLNRAIMSNEIFDSQTGTYMIVDNTNGLIEKYYNDDGDQTDINLTNNVRATAGQDTFSDKFDNVTAFEALQTISTRSRVTGNDIPFDFWVDFDIINSNISLWFNERNTTSSGVTLYQDADFSRDFQINKGGLESVFNWIKVFGSKNRLSPNDTNTDFWTEQANDGAYQAFWTESGGDVGTTVTRETTIKRIGDSCVVLEADVNDTPAFKLELDDTDAFSSVNTLNLMSSGNGITLDDNYDLFLDFWAYMDRSYAEDWGVKLWFYDDALADFFAVGGQQQYEATNLNGVYLVYTPSKWQKYRFRINDTFSTADTAYLAQIGFICDGGVPADNLKLYIDGLHFTQVDNELVTTPASHATDATSITAYGKREQHYFDRTFKTQTEIDDMADKLLIERKDPSEEYILPLVKARNDIDLGETFVLNSNLHGISDQTVRCTELRFNERDMEVVGDKSTIFNTKGNPVGAFNQRLARGIGEVARR